MPPRGRTTSWTEGRASTSKGLRLRSLHAHFVQEFATSRTRSVSLQCGLTRAHNSGLSTRRPLHHSLLCPRFRVDAESKTQPVSCCPSPGFPRSCSDCSLPPLPSQESPLSREPPGPLPQRESRPLPPPLEVFPSSDFPLHWGGIPSPPGLRPVCTLRCPRCLARSCVRRAQSSL